MSTISTNDDPRAAIEGGVALTEAIIGAVAGKLSSESQDIPNPTQENSTLKDADWNQQQGDWANVQEKPPLTDSELVAALLEKVPEEFRDTVTIQVGSTKVLKPGGEPKLNESQANMLRTLLEDPSKTSGTIKMYDDGGNHFLKVSDGKVRFDTLNILPKQTIEKISAPSLTQNQTKWLEGVSKVKAELPAEIQNLTNDYPAMVQLAKQDPSLMKTVDLKIAESSLSAGMKESEIAQAINGSPLESVLSVSDFGDHLSNTQQALRESEVQSLVIAPDPVAQNIEAVEKAIAPGIDQQALVDAISRLESRVAELEQRITQKPMKLVNSKIGTWMNGIRDNIAAQLHQTTDKIAQRVHEVADKISVTTTEKVNEIKDSVSEKVDDIKQNVAETVSDIRENLTDGMELARDVAVNTVHDVIDAGMERHSQAFVKVNETAQDVVGSVKQAMEDPRQAYIDKVANPIAQRMIEVAEKIPNRVTIDEQGNKSLNVGTYQYQQSQSGEISVSRAGEKLTAANLTQKDVSAIQEMSQVISPKQTEQMKQTQKVEPPKPKIKMSV